MNISKRSFAVPLSLVVAGCASLPDVTATYWFPKTETTIQAKLTLACSPGKDHVYGITTIASSNATSNDYGLNPGVLPFKSLNGTYADADIKIGWTDDGRLSSINQSTQGQGAAIIKSVATLVTTVAPLGIRLAGDNVPKACAIIDRQGSGSNDAKAITLSYHAKIDYSANDRTSGDFTAPAPIAFASDDAVTAILDPEIKAALPSLPRFEVRLAYKPYAMVSAPAEALDAKDVFKLEVSRPGIARLDVYGPDANLQNDGKTPIWHSDIVVPLRSKESHMFLPIPKARLFGKQVFGLSMNASGLISGLQYTKSAGASDAIDAANSMAKALKEPSAADQVAALKAEADLIAQQQRLTLCRANPTTCK